MTTSVHSSIEESSRSALPRPTRTALLVGLALSALFTSWVAGNVPLVTLAMWPLGLALGLLSVGLFRLRSKGDMLPGMLIGGQFLGVVAITLLLIASLG